MGAGDKDEELDDAYELLELDEEATEKDITSAYRKLSLKVHPDRNPDDPEAAQKFDKLTRVKELLLDPVRRGGLDRRRKQKRDLEQRHAAEDAKRRKLREDLEGREQAAVRSVAASRAAEAAAEARKDFLRSDWSSRLREREAKMAASAADIAEQVTASRASADESRVQVSWREGQSVSVELLQKELGSFDIKSMEVGATEARVLLGSREDAIRAVLHCRERKHQLGFRVTLAAAKKAEPGAKDAQQKRAEARQAKAERKAAAPSSGAASFGDWEAKMLAEIQGLAAAQSKRKVAAQ